MTSSSTLLKDTGVGQNHQGSAVVLIPAYQPGEALVELVEELSRSRRIEIVVVDDGSSAEHHHLFQRVAEVSQVTVVRHAINLGKGAALKTGINFILCRNRNTSGVVTVDADGQHTVPDILNVCDRFDKNQDTLVLGVRTFQGSVPLRSRLGNELTKGVLHVVLGKSLTDTQTGLRAIPRHLLGNLLKVSANGYEFELEMLIAVKHLGIKIIEEPIQTIYEPGNPTSHFQPLLDSMRIYFVLLRFSLISLTTAALDNLCFYLLLMFTGSIIPAQIGGRIASMLFNYPAVRKAAFHSEQPHSKVLPRYLALVAINTVLSYVGIRFLTNALPIGIVPAKLFTETLLFIANFAIQRDFIFTRRKNAAEASDWDGYYKAVPASARFTGRGTQSILSSALKGSPDPKSRPSTIVQIGGANSFMVDEILDDIQPGSYHVVDQSAYDLSILNSRLQGRHDVVLHEGDVSGMPALDLKADIVFSVGMIEHLDKAGRSKAIQSHFDLLRSGGVAIISFTTPTRLYSGATALLERAGFQHASHQEPLGKEEVVTTMRECGEIVFEKTMWPFLMTQELIVARKS